MSQGSGNDSGCHWNTPARGCRRPRISDHAAVAVVTAGTTAVYNTYRTAKAAQEGRVEQRAADGYIKVLSLAELETHWLDAWVFHIGIERDDPTWSVVKRDVPKPAESDRATAAALIAAFASEPVRASHVAWRQAADDLDMRLKGIGISLMEDGDPYATPPDKWMKELTDVLQPKEREARKALAEAVAHELGHRKPQKGLRIIRR
jgi:hypothetical protein